MLAQVVRDAAGDTWGIPGPTFLWIYIGLIVFSIFDVIVMRRILGRARAPITDVGVLTQSLDPYQMAALNGGLDLALVVAQMREVRLNGSASPNHLVEHVLHETHALLPTGTAKDVRNRAATDPRLTSFMDDLASRGLIRTERQRALTRLAALAPVAVCGIGVARYAAGTSNGKPTGNLVILIVFAGFVLLCSLGGGARAGRPTRLARKVLDHAKAQGDHRTYTGYVLQQQTPLDTPAMFGIALLGVPVLAMADPSLVPNLGVSPLLGSPEMASSSSFSSGSNCSSGSSCSSSSCSSSSCGGGGCGGGGCGG